MMGTAGIAAEKYSHVKYFPNHAAYDDYYDIVVDIGDIGKVKYLRASAPEPPRELVVPAADGVVMPSSSDDVFEV